MLLIVSLAIVGFLVVKWRVWVHEGRGRRRGRQGREARRQ